MNRCFYVKNNEILDKLYTLFLNIWKLVFQSSWSQNLPGGLDKYVLLNL